MRTSALLLPFFGACAPTAEPVVPQAVWLAHSDGTPVEDGDVVETLLGPAGAIHLAADVYCRGGAQGIGEARLDARGPTCLDYRTDELPSAWCTDRGDGHPRLLNEPVLPCRLSEEPEAVTLEIRWADAMQEVATQELDVVIARPW